MKNSTLIKLKELHLKGDLSDEDYNQAVVDHQVSRHKIFPGQGKLLNSTKPNLVSFSGVGAGKTFVGSRWIAREADRAPRGQKLAIIAPTYRHLKRHHLKYALACLKEIGLIEQKHFVVNRSDMVIEIFHNDVEIMFLSSDNYQSFVAWEFLRAWWDEPGFCSEELREFVDERVGRTEDGQIFYTGVIQRPNWYYTEFGPNEALEVTQSYTLPKITRRVSPEFSGLICPRFRESESTLVMHSSSYENVFLKESYFKRLYDSYGYDEKLFKAHVLGMAVPINKNSVYSNFNEGISILECSQLRDKVPYINLCFDFNFGQMSVATLQSWENDWFVTWSNNSLAKVTEDACFQFMEAFPPSIYGSFGLDVYGDQAGYARSPQIRTQDGSYQIIREILKPHYPRLRIRAKRHTIPQEVRVRATNKLHAQSGTGKKGLYADKSCKKLIAGWHLTEWDSSGSIKKGANDDMTHMPEAIDYGLHSLEPMVEQGEVDYTKFLINQ